MRLQVRVLQGLEDGIHTAGEIAQMKIRDRIKELRRVKAGDLRPRVTAIKATKPQGKGRHLRIVG